MVKITDTRQHHLVRPEDSIGLKVSAYGAIQIVFPKYADVLCDAYDEARVLAEKMSKCVNGNAYDGFYLDKAAFKELSK